MTSKLEPNRAQRPTLVGYLLYKSFPQFPQEKKNKGQHVKKYKKGC